MKEILTVEKLRKIRKRKGMTQAEFAGLVGYSETYIQKLEQGQKPITSEFTENLLKAIDLERAYRKACRNYYEVHEKLNKKHSIMVNLFYCIVCFCMLVLFIFFIH